MQSVQDPLTLMLRAYRTILCDACLALKMGAFPKKYAKQWS